MKVLVLALAVLALESCSASEKMLHVPTAALLAQIAPAGKTLEANTFHKALKRDVRGEMLKSIEKGEAPNALLLVGHSLHKRNVIKSIEKQIEAGRIPLETLRVGHSISRRDAPDAKSVPGRYKTEPFLTRKRRSVYRPMHHLQFAPNLARIGIVKN